MHGELLSFYLHESDRHGGRLLYEWLLEEARRLGIPGGSAFRAIAGYGRHGVLHEQHFFELAGGVPVRVDFLLASDDAERLLQALRQAQVHLFFARMPMRFGLLQGNAPQEG